MRQTIRQIALCQVFVACVAVASAFCVSTGETVKLEGYVISAQQRSVILRTKDAGDVTISVTEFTKITTPKGLFRKQHMPTSSLVPGLRVKVKGVGSNAGHVLAQTISFSGNDYKVATAIKAGVAPVEARLDETQRTTEEHGKAIQAHEEAIQSTQQNVVANQQQIQSINDRFAKLPEYDVKFTASVHFPVGSAKLTPEAKQELLRLAKNIQPLRAYLVQVIGHADATGAAEMNNELSMRRAEAVITFLQQETDIPVRRVLMPAAMGETHPISSNNSPAGRLDNRRAEVQILVNRALEVSEEHGRKNGAQLADVR